MQRSFWGDAGYGVNWFDEESVDMGITLCISGRKLRDKAIPFKIVGKRDETVLRSRLTTPKTAGVGQQSITDFQRYFYLPLLSRPLFYSGCVS